MRVFRAMEESAPRRHEIVVLITVSFLLLATFLGWQSGRSFNAGASLTLLIFFAGILLFVPEAAPAIVLVAAYDFLGFVDPTAFGRIPGLFKLRDLLVMVTVLVAFLQTLLARREASTLGIPPVRASLVFSLYVFAVVVYTVAAGHGTLNLALRVAAPYLYYLIMIPVIVFTTSLRKLHLLLLVLLVLALVPEILSAFQIITHRPISPFVTVLWMNVGGLSVPRSYVLSFNLTGVALLCLFGTYLYAPSSRVRLLCALSAVAVFTGVVLTFGRAFWIGTLGGLLFLFIVAYIEGENRDALLTRTAALWVRIGVATAVVVVFLAMAGKDKSLLEFSGLVGRRFVSTFSEVTEVGGSFGGRLQESAFRITLFRESPVLGAGYVHDSSEFASELPRKSVGTADSGAITVLAQTGLLGMAAVCVLVAIFLRRGFSIFRRLRNPLFKGVSLGIVSFYVQAIITFAGLTGIAFTHYAGICTIGLVVGLQEVLLRIDGKLSQA